MLNRKNENKTNHKKKKFSIKGLNSDGEYLLFYLARLLALNFLISLSNQCNFQYVITKKKCDKKFYI
jgi:hypothetical protein